MSDAGTVSAGKPSVKRAEALNLRVQEIAAPILRSHGLELVEAVVRVHGIPESGLPTRAGCFTAGRRGRPPPFGLKMNAEAELHPAGSVGLSGDTTEDGRTGQTERRTSVGERQRKRGADMIPSRFHRGRLRST